MSFGRFVIACCLLSFGVGCTYTVPFTIQKSNPVYDVVGRGVARERRIVVLSPRSTQQVSGSLTAETLNAQSTAGGTAGGVHQTTDYSVISVTAEKALLGQGYRVIDQGNLYAAMSDKAVREALTETRSSGASTLLSEALLLGRAVKADAALLIRAAKLNYSSYAVARVPDLSLASCSNNLKLYEPIAEVDMVAVNIADGEVIWSGNIKLRAADLLTRDWNATHTYHSACGDGETRWNVAGGCYICYRTDDFDIPLSTQNGGTPSQTWMLERAVKQLIERFATASP